MMRPAVDWRMATKRLISTLHVPTVEVDRPSQQHVRKRDRRDSQTRGGRKFVLFRCELGGGGATIMDQSIETTSTKKNLASRKYKPISSTFHDKFHYMVKLSRTSKMIHRVRILRKN
mmetsp:Transcript_27975/g.50647  ORF Transcript_27975/g.50647 Transcript_27975/m.50647 type:complete len:117 (+) Transcript_27975:96-446(+)